MADGYCWVCDRSVDRDPCPTCGTSLYRARALVRSEPVADEVFDTAPQLASRTWTARPVLVVLAVVAVLALIFWLFQSAAVIS